MIVIHALGLDDGIYFWAETSSPSSRGKKGAHPFAVSSDELLQLVKKISAVIDETNFSKGSIRLLLPSTSKSPLPSPKLLSAGNGEKRSGVKISEWYVPSLMIDIALGAELLVSLPVDPPLGVTYSDSLLFWTEVSKFNMELITRQSFAPSIEKLGDDDGTETLESRWKVFLSGDDMRRIEKLSDMMPMSSMASAGNEDTDRARIVLDFINHSTDRFIREALSRPELRAGGTSKGMGRKWIQSLVTNSPRMKLKHGEAEILNESLNLWISALFPQNRDAAFRTCFRIEPPDASDTKDGKWKVTYHLQATDDRSLIVPAADIWKGGSSVTTFISKHFESPQERLLEDLGRVSAMFPPIEASLRDARPTSISLETGDAYLFMRDVTPLLEQAGFGILFPSWWRKGSSTLGVRLRFRPNNHSVGRKGLLGIDGILKYDWSVALGEEALSPEEFRKLADLKVPIVNIRGRWVEVVPEEIEKAIRFFEQIHGNGEMRLGEAVHLANGSSNDAGIPVVAAETEGWIANILGSVSDGITIDDVSPPESFVGQLRPYQVRGLSWLDFLRKTGLGACLADDMGLGKTIQLISLLLLERASLSTSRTLIVCPMSIVGNWQREIMRFGPSLKVMIHHGSDRLAGKEFKRKVNSYDVVITTYSLIARDIDLISSVQWDRVVLDEAQNIKNSETKQSRAIRMLKSASRVAMTGTPVENRLSEFWSIMDFLNPGYLGSPSDFRRNFAIPIERFHDAQRTEILRKVARPFLLRRLKTDPNIIHDLPRKMEMKVFCNLTKEQATLYEAVVKDMMEKIELSEGIERKGLVLSTLTKLKQVCNHPAQFLHDNSSLDGRSGKVARLEEMIEEAMAEGDKSLVFTQFREMGTMIQKGLEERFGVETLFLHGGTPKKERDSMVMKFQEEKNGPRVFILSLKAGGVGLNLTAANRVFHFDRWWNPAVENQATDRAFRIGQRRDVQVHKFVTVGTLEERIDTMIEQKKELAENVVGTGEAWLTEMSTSQLRDLFKLSREAVGE